jgi:P-type conjugative transfer protein TrbJ
MKKTLNKIGLSTALAATLLVNVPTPSHAIFGVGDFVFDIPHTIGTIAGWLAEAENWYETVAHYKNQYDTYKSMLENIGELPPEQWAEFSASFLDLKNSLAYQEGLSSAATDFDSKFDKYFPGFDKYLSDAQGGNLDFQGIYKNLNQSTNDTVNGALKSIGLQFKDLENDEVTLKKLQQLSQSATGQLGAIQAASAIATHQTHTIKKLQETIMIQTNMQGQYYAMKNEKRVFQQAQSKAKVTNGITPTIGDERPTGKW